MKDQEGAKYKLVLTGGHAATTAVAVVQEIKLLQKPWSLYWIGVKNAIEGKKIVTLESEVLPRLGVKFLPLIAGRLQRKFTIWTIPSILKIPVGFIQSFYYLISVRPNAILSFGGFASFPVVFCSKLLGIPVVIHEQTSAAGRANRVSSRFATVIALSRMQSLKYFSKDKSVIVGNPIMKEIQNVKPRTRPQSPPIIFVTGGSRGSQSINSVVEQALKTLLKEYKIIHQTGGLDYLKFSEIKQKLPMTLRKNYQVFLRVNPLTISDFYKNADMIVARAGANTVSEIMATRRPAILIPLPISYLDEQTKNAEIASEFGIAKIIKQNELTSDLLITALNKMILKYSQIVKSVGKKENLDKNASAKLVNIVGEYMK